MRIDALENRQLAVRRIEDYIYYMLLNRQTHAYRRFLAHREAPAVDADVLRQALKFAEARNSETPLRFSLVADLTTRLRMVHSRSPRNAPSPCRSPNTRAPSLIAFLEAP